MLLEARVDELIGLWEKHLRGKEWSHLDFIIDRAKVVKLMKKLDKGGSPNQREITECVECVNRS